VLPKKARWRTVVRRRVCGNLVHVLSSKPWLMRTPSRK
jgi:hypothetical protein